MGLLQCSVLPRILIVAMCCTLVSCKGLVEKYKRSNSGISALDKKVLYDFRSAMPTAVPTIDNDTQRKVYSPIPPAGCPVAAGAPVRKMEIASTASGSFTYAAEQETVYLVTGLACGWPNKVVVLGAGKVQASSDSSYSVIAQTSDLNHDDKNELLLMGETSHNGELSREASLQTFEKGALRPVEDFGIVYHDTCALFAHADEAKRKSLIAAGLTPYIESVVVYYLPHPGHEMPSFTAERYRAPCAATPPAPSDWQPVSPKSAG